MLLLACAIGALCALGAIGSGMSGSGSRDVSPALSTSAVVAVPLHQYPQPPLASIAEPVTNRFWSEIRSFAPQHDALTDAQIVSYYGSPYTPDMGLLGTADPETIADEVEARAAAYDRLNGPAGVIPALHFVYAVAQPEATSNGLYLQFADDNDVREYITLARERGMLLFLDLQIGRSSVQDEIERVVPFLRESNVHLALDPEFAVGGVEVPGEHLGSLSGEDIDQAQRALQQVVDQQHLPPKLLIVHQFDERMIEDAGAIQRYPAVDLIIDMDGFGPAEIKRVKYEDFASRAYAAHGAIKLFLDYDPDLMSAEDVLALTPRPAIVIYQ